MKTFQVARPSQEHIKKMLKKAKEVNKKQIEVLEMVDNLKEVSLKTKFGFNIKHTQNEKC